MAISEKGKNTVMKMLLKSRMHGKHKKRLALNISIITTAVHGLNSLIKKETLVNWI